MRSKFILATIFFIAVIFISINVSAGFFDLFEKTITGRAGSRPTNVTVTLTGPNPANITYVSAIASTPANESGARNITFSVHMYDPDGVADLNDTSVYANFTKTELPPSTPRTTGSYCAHVSDLDSYTANYSCSILMWYWDGDGWWNVSVRGRDLGAGTWAFNLTTNFTYQQLKAMVIAPTSLTWPGINPGQKNQTSDNDPTYINNTGNYNGTIDIIGKALLGERDPSYIINATNFTVGLVSTGVGSNLECANTNILQNGTAITVANSYSNPGNLSKNDEL